MQSETPQLTPRQLEVAKLVACTLTNREIACRLGVEARTIKDHVFNISHRLGTKGRVQIALIAVARGWVSPAEVAAVLWPRLAISAAANREIGYG
jgi:DNA-binding NarL/FixJ family response regulator